MSGIAVGIAVGIWSYSWDCIIGQKLDQQSSAHQ